MRQTFREYDSKIILTKKSITIVEYLQESFSKGSLDLFQYDSKIIRTKTDEELTLERVENRNKYYTRRKNELEEIVECNDFQSFMTVTFEKDLNDSELKKAWKRGRERLELYYKTKIKFICRIEEGSINERGHLHLITDLKFLNNYHQYWYDKKGNKKLNKKRATDEIKELIRKTRNKDLKATRQRMFKEGASLLKCIMAVGHIDIQNIKDTQKCMNYVLKYITKDMGKKELYKRCVWTSYGLEKGVHITDIKLLSQLEEYVRELIKNSPKHDFDYTKTFSNDFINKVKINTKLKDKYYELKEINLNSELEKNREWLVLEKNTRKIIRGTVDNDSLAIKSKRNYLNSFSKEYKLKCLARKHRVYLEMLEVQEIIDISNNYFFDNYRNMSVLEELKSNIALNRLSKVKNEKIKNFKGVVMCY